MNILAVYDCHHKAKLFTRLGPHIIKANKSLFDGVKPENCPYISMSNYIYEF